ncbi:hypothetical protein BDN71DRAFT_1512408 [Pleurotus eryngii]|uniref:Uncharacterized protein n=1 Tax=Pleurotus eryngii TaxID=5323 RepID=A0A9P5ZJZ6_PLEER|nr:hypothetical protein BDN71DRAFT_1512408 [Pleurotus eryngii]
MARTHIKKKKVSPLYLDLGGNDDDDKEEEESDGDSDGVVAMRPMTQASAKKVAKPVTSKPRKEAMIAIGEAVQPVVPKPQQKAPVKVVHSNDSNDEPILPATSKPRNKARVATDKAIQLARKAQVMFNNSGYEVIHDVETSQPATVAIKEGQPDQPSDDENEQAQIIHSSWKRHVAHIQSPHSSTEHGMKPESPTPVGSGTGRPALKLCKSLVAEDSGRAAESSKRTDTTSSTGKAAPPVAEAVVTIAEPESTTPVGPWTGPTTGPTLKLRKPLVAEEVPKHSVELSKAADATSLASEVTLSDAEAAVLKCHKTKCAAEELSLTSKAALPNTEATVPKGHKTKHVASTSEVAAQAVPKCSKTKNAATLSTGEAMIPVEPTITNVGSAGELTPETKAVTKLGKMKRSATSTTSKVMHKAKCSKTKHATGSTTEAAPPPPVLKCAKTKDPLRAKHVETGNDKVQQGPHQCCQPPSLDGINTMAWEDRYCQPPGLDGSNTAPWDSYRGPFNAQLDPGMDSSNSSQYPPNWPYPLLPGYGRPHLPAFDSLDTQHGPPSYFSELYNPYVCPSHPNYPQGRPAHDMYSLQDGSSSMYLCPPL